MKTEAQTGVMQPQAKELLEPSEARRDKEAFSTGFEGSAALPTP